VASIPGGSELNHLCGPGGYWPIATVHAFNATQSLSGRSGHSENRIGVATCNSGRCNLLQRRDMWGTFWRVLALPDENFLVTAVHSFDSRRRTMAGIIKGASALSPVSTLARSLDGRQPTSTRPRMPLVTAQPSRFRFRGRILDHLCSEWPICHISMF
jgi:hypothetical protein